LWVCVCMCVYLFLCDYACVYVSAWLCVSVCACLYLRDYVCVCVCVLQLTRHSSLPH
jgi:hypothetical protein